MGLYADAGLINIAKQLFEQTPHRDVVLWTSLVSAYAKCGLPDEARHAFDQMPERNAVSWAAVISAYSQGARHKEALLVFDEMHYAGVEPTEATLISVLSSAGYIGALKEGKWVHDYVIHNQIFLTASLGTALLSMYAKCGCIDDAIQVFAGMPQRDELAWTTMISALAMHGQGELALVLFYEMLSLGLRPDHVTFVGVLSACSHAGLIEEGRYHFKCMKDTFRIEPRVEHFGCMVDILGRGGYVEEAWDFVQAMPMEPDVLVLKSLLSACASYGRVEYAEWAAKKLNKLDPGIASSYVLLANAYANLGRWADAERVRKMMRDRGVTKTPGCSLIEVGGVVHQFVAGENEEHHQIKEIKSTLHQMDKLLRLVDQSPTLLVAVNSNTLVLKEPSNGGSFLSRGIKMEMRKLRITYK
ncbi:PREDICTED: pentatricopeptide repeat-containing protein At3g62890-like [Nelumbo nucifera]|uniref:Pentatricopeptide repeat-containing protein At3g62890-like n=1 Tax=Nelumbo nucifera TaxID=4432 RepID=A0A1U8AIF4_NELNU|nr:PREDICTED: pentatricopeptide repeat-containing protein At3g62890-like [Nelumbo nucifera]